MKSTGNELININDARSLLNSEGLAHLSQIIYGNRTINKGNRMYITRKQFENCLKKETATAKVSPVKQKLFYI